MANPCEVLRSDDGRLCIRGFGEADHEEGDVYVSNGTAYAVGARSRIVVDGEEVDVREVKTMSAGGGFASKAPLAFRPPTARPALLRLGYDLWKGDPLAGAIVNLTTFFTYGRGVAIQATGTQKDVLEKFWRRNGLGLRAKVMSDEATAFGEVFLKLVVHREDVKNPNNPNRFLWRKGHVQVVPISPELVSAIDHDPLNIDDVELYSLRYETGEKDGAGQTQTVTEDVKPLDKWTPGDEAALVHLKFNAASNDLFGTSDLVRIAEWLENYKEFLRDGVTINRLYRSPCFDITIKDGDDVDVRRAIRRYQDWVIGSNPVHNDKEEWKILEFSGANVSQEDSRRALLLAVAAGASFPEYMLADGSNANLACHDEETEVLTTDGWLPHAEVTTEHVVACVGEDGRMAWLAPQKVHEYDHEGEMVRVEGKYLDVLVTPNHRMRVRQPGAHWQMMEARDLLRSGSGTSRLVTAQHAAAPGRGRPGQEPAIMEVVVPGCRRRTRRNLPDEAVPIDDMLRFLGLFVSEGGLNDGGERRVAHTIYLSQRTPEKIPIFDEVLGNLPWKFCRHEDREGSVRWSLGNKALFAWLAAECGTRAWRKRLPEWCLIDLTEHQSRLLLEYMVIGDGTFEPERRPGSMSYRTTSSLLADQVQVLALRCGFAANVVQGSLRTTTTDRPVYQVNIRTERTEPGFKRLVTSSWYEGKVYCLTVPTGIYVTRRRGKVAILGNSAKAQQLPAVKKFEDRQESFRQFWIRVFNFVLDVAEVVGDVGGLEPEEDFEGDQAWKVDVKFPPITLERDKEIAEANRIGLEDGYLSPQTAAARSGLDYDKEMSLRLQAALDEERHKLEVELFLQSEDFEALRAEAGVDEGPELPPDDGEAERQEEMDGEEVDVEEPVEVGGAEE